MSVFTAVILYFLLFWTVLFAVLPWGNRAPDAPESGTAGSAPENPRISGKFLITAVIAAILLGMIFAAVKAELIDFQAISRQMMEEDYGS